MANLKYFYAKLSCPNSNDGEKFLALIQNSWTFEKFDYRLTNIPNNLNNANSGDIIFILISGDYSNKRRYFKELPQFIDYENGLHCVGQIQEIDSKNKEVVVTITGLKEVVTKEDLYFFPQFINNLGAATKGSPNQAGLYELDTNIAHGLIDYLNKRELLPINIDFFQSLDIDNKLFSEALQIYHTDFKEKELTQKVFQKYTKTNNKAELNSQDHQIIDVFIKWFNKPENFKISYQGIVNKENLLFWNQTYFNNQLFKITGETKDKAIENIIAIVNNSNNPKWDDFNISSSKGAPKAVLGNSNYLKFIKEFIESDSFILEPKLDRLDIKLFFEACKQSGLQYSNQLLTRYISSLATKPFVILSGLSGSGKTKLAQAFAQWICESKEQFCIVPVGADWINREPLLGYVNALEPSKYVLPENRALELIINANKEENQSKPHFLILDEMNLSHVERYFADFLSVMETKDKFKLHTSGSPLDGGNGIQVAKSYSWPKNLFVVGTVNIDETTYMFSPKVLDRANVIEFRIDEDEMSTYLENPVEFTEPNGEGASMAASFVEISKAKSKTNPEELKTALNNFFTELQEIGSEFGYRTASEIQILFSKIDAINPRYESKINAKIDIAIMQKLLPKLHGSRTKLISVLKLLACLCYETGKDGKSIINDDDKDKIFEKSDTYKDQIIYPISLEKITRMYRNVIANGFTSYAEA